MAKPKWKTLKHALGSATKLPAMIQELSGSEQQVRRVEPDLRAMLVSPASWFSASAPAVLELLAIQSPTAWLLACDCLTSGHLEVLSGRVGRDQLERLWSEIKPAALPLVSQALGSGDEELASAAGYFAGFLAEPKIDAQLVTLLSERKAEACTASGMLALAVSSKLRGEGLSAEIARFHAKSPLELVAHAAATLLHESLDPGAADQAFRALLQLEIGSTVWTERRTFDVVHGVVGCRDQEERQRLATSLADALGQAERVSRAAGDQLPRVALEWAAVAIDWEARQAQAGYEILPLDRFDSVQRRVLEGLSGRHGLNVVGSSAPHGLVERRRWLGLDPPSPLELELDTKLDGKAVKWPVWRVWRHIKQTQSSTLEIPEPISDRASPEECLRMLIEVGLDAYGLYYAGKPYPTLASYEALLAETDCEHATSWAALLASSLGPMVRDGDYDHKCMQGIDPYVALLLVLVRGGASFDPAWDSLVPYIGKYAEELHLALPEHRREALIYERLLNDTASYPHRSLAALAIKLSPSYRVTRLLLDRILPQRERFKKGGVRDQLDAHLKALQEAATEHPDVARALGEVEIRD
ncbi:MAG: hypothetical protein R3B89_03570 [Polyangiaceae bacterium]